MARVVLVAHWMASMARSLGNPGNEWHSTLIASGCEEGFFAKHKEATAEHVVDYLVRDLDNPSSILSCIQTARHNARAISSDRSI